MQKFQDVVLDSQGRPVAGAVIAVQEYPSGDAATVYQTNAVGTAYTPTTDAYGAFYFYAPNGNYNYTVTVANVLRKTVTNVQLYDPSATDVVWTPSLISSTGGTEFEFVERYGFYTKIGTLVTASMYYYASVIRSGNSSDIITLGGLPFVARNSNAAGFGALALSDMVSIGRVSGVVVIGGTTTANFTGVLEDYLRGSTIKNADLFMGGVIQYYTDE